MFNSKEYWENRYKTGGTSGAGSYGTLAKYKSDFINNFINENNIKSLIEYGCGDGNNLSLLKCDKIIGLDVSKKAIELSKERIPNGIFYNVDDFDFIENKSKSDLILSLDVIYHLIEDDVYEDYIKNLCELTDKWIIIYSPNEDNNNYSKHVKSRKFVNNEILINKFNLISIIKNEYPLEKFGAIDGSFSDWYIYLKK